MAVQTVFSIIQAASNSWEMFSVLYFIVGMGQIANYCAAFILGKVSFLIQGKGMFTSSLSPLALGRYL